MKFLEIINLEYFLLNSDMDNLLRSDVNYIICENYEEIFFDVFDIKFKDSDSLCLESVAKFQGNPVVMYDNFPMVLVKGDKNTQGIYLNEQYTEIPSDEIIEEDVEYSREDQIDNHEYILEEIRNSKLQAKEFAENIKRIKIQEANEDIKEKKKELKKLLENTKEDLIGEFINISESIKSSLFDKNSENLESLKDNLEEELSKQKLHFEKAIANDLDNSYEDFTKNLNSLVGKMWKMKVSPLLEQRMGKLDECVETKIQSIKNQFEDVLNEKVGISSFEKLQESLENLKVSQIDLHDVVQKNKSKVDNKIANLKQNTKKIQEEITSQIEESISLVESFYNDKIQQLQEQTFEANEKTRKFLVDTINESKAYLLEEIRNIQKEKPIEFIVESKGSTETISLDKLKKDYDKLISEKVSNEMVGLKKFIYASGGGTNATQYQDGGIMNGDLTVRGVLSSYSLVSPTISSQNITSSTLSSQNLTSTSISSQNLRTTSLVASALSSNSGVFDYLQFTTTTPTYLESRVYYDWSDHSLTYFNDQSAMALNLGREMIVRVRNHQQGLIPDGVPVFISGAQDQYPRIELASCSAYDKSQVIGITTHDIQNNSFGYVTIGGEVKGLNTNAEYLVEGMPIYLGLVPGTKTSTKPSKPYYVVRLGMCEYAHNTQGKILVNVERISIDVEDIRNLGTTSFSTSSLSTESLSVGSGGIMFTDTVWDDIRVDSSSFDYTNTTVDPTLVDYSPGGATLKLYEFALNDAAYANVQMPHGYKKATPIYFHVHYTPGARGITERGKTVGWKLDVTCAQYNQVFGATTQLNLSTTIPVDCQDHQHLIGGSVAFTPPSSFNGSGILLMKLSRTDTGEDDTWSGATTGLLPLFLSLDGHYEIERVGSNDMNPN